MVSSQEKEKPVYLIIFIIIIHTGKMKKIILYLFTIVLVLSCVNQTKERNVRNTSNTEGREIVMATLYNHYAAEYSALCLQAYNVAGERILKLYDSGADPSGLAIVVDIDETILDNSPYQALTVKTGEQYPSHWDEWCNLSVAEAIPGALKFLSLADSLGFQVFYLSNRKKNDVGEATRQNLLKIGFPQVEDSHLLLREPASNVNQNPSNKETRREKIKEMGYDIALFCGDNLGDFFEDSPDVNLRKNQVDSLMSLFGEKFIVLPNAMYGNWPASIGIDGSSGSYDSLIDKMTTMFYE
jgi:5'-nucleotidase (lipoprotein e(P4) family)